MPKKVLRLYISETFDAAHRLPDHPGKCSGLHGHTWKVEVWLVEDLSDLPRGGMLYDFGKIKEKILELDHKYLNEELSEEYLPPTAENLVRYFWDHLPASRIRVWESSTSYAELEVG
jgi:6-pyruvoyltetrahydropterin/6-carboxytetrahydropterin synthase